MSRGQRGDVEVQVSLVGIKDQEGLLVPAHLDFSPVDDSQKIDEAVEGRAWGHDPAAIRAQNDFRYPEGIAFDRFSPPFGRGEADLAALRRPSAPSGIGESSARMFRKR